MSAFEDFIQLELPRRPWTYTDGAQETIPFEEVQVLVRWNLSTSQMARFLVR
jgi:hypothetical protein